MSKLSKVSDQLMGLTISELTQAQNMIHEIKSMKAKAALSVGANVFVVQKTKKTPGTVRKINQTRAVVDLVVSPITGETAPYNVPFSMIQPVKEAA